MSKIVQEKFEIREPLKPEGVEGGGWASDKSARNSKGSHPADGCLPPGMDMEDQYNCDIKEQGFSMGGETDRSNDWNPEAVKNGYTRRTMRPTDDMYTREHNDAFYDEITVEGKTGFLERNNMLDRI